MSDLEAEKSTEEMPILHVKRGHGERAFIWLERIEKNYFSQNAIPRIKPLLHEFLVTFTFVDSVVYKHSHGR